MTEPAPGRPLGRAAEAALVALARAGDDAAFEELVLRRQGWLRQLLRRLCRDHALADDLAQQTLLQAWQHLADLREPGAFAPWLRRLAVNHWLQHARRTSVLTQLGTQTLQAAQAGATPAFDAAVAERLDLDAALAELAPQCRLCIVLTYGEGMSHSDVSRLTGLPLGTVKSHIRRGSEQLRRLLRAYQPNEVTA
ncbi:MAG TPA: RNA polymerase sigma factor [Steroidobacteraceae bacterium]|nr:RNA polymerase sigma factor [Steroidobacteraceae bacterium]